MTYIQFRFSIEAKRVGHGRNHEPCIAKLAQHSVKKQELDMSIIVFLYCARIMIIGKKDVHILMMKTTACKESVGIHFTGSDVIPT